jgi:NAD(P)-dependent dehydrogenase (short-subunit alcohol dehydrogenase family)
MNTTQTQTAIVTGASSGIGLALTGALLDNGYRVVANARHASTAGTLKPSRNLVLVDGDVADPDTASSLTRTAVERFGSVDLLVNNAGIFIAKPFTDYTIEDFQRLVATNLTGFFHVTQTAVRQMRSQGSGHIVAITTTLASQPVQSVPASLPILTKGGLNALTRALAIEYAKEGVRVNAVAPGIVDTPMHPREAHGFLRTLHPIERLATVDEIVDAVLYLTKATFVTGEVIHVDGGAHAGRS